LFASCDEHLVSADDLIVSNVLMSGSPDGLENRRRRTLLTSDLFAPG